MVRMGQKLASPRQRRSFRCVDADGCSTSSSIVDEGYVVVYTTDERRFTIPLDYLKNEVFVELLKMAEEEYGLPSEKPITLPHDAVTMEYVISLIQRHVAEDLKRALLISITSGRCSASSFNQEQRTNQKLLICSF